MKFLGKSRDLREIWRKIQKRFRMKFFPNSLRIKKIDEVAITPTLKCCLNCAMCHQKEIKHWKDMDIESFRKTLNQLKSAGVSKISIVGGEIFVKKDIKDFIRMMEKMNFKYDLSSNLFFVPDIEKLKNLKGLEMVTTSIDGDEKLHDKIRGVSGAFKRTTENIKKLRDMDIFVDVACVIQKANFDKLEEITEIICNLGASKISFLIENSITDEQKENTKKIIKNITGQDSEIMMSSIKNPFGSLSEVEYKKISEKVEAIRRITEKYNIPVSFPVQISHQEVLNKKVGLKEYTCGMFGGYGLMVYNDTSLHQCCFIKMGGNHELVRDNPYQIINSPEYLKFRKAFKERGAFEMCRLCCALKKK